MSAASKRNRDSVITAARANLVRIALWFGLLNAVVPLTVTLATRDVAEIALGALWVIGWIAAIYNTEPLLRLLEQTWPRTFLVLLVGLTAIATVAATGGTESPLKTGGNWLGWAATVATTKRASMVVASVFSTSLVAAFLVAGNPVGELAGVEDRYVVVTGMMNPFVIVFVALALMGVFNWVIGAAPGTLWNIRSGGEASSEALTELFRAPAVPLLTAGNERSAGPARAALSEEERALVKDLAKGRTVQQIALERGWTDPMAYRRLATARGKVGAQTNEHLVVLAWEPTW